MKISRIFSEFFNLVKINKSKEIKISSYEKDDKKALEKDWQAIGEAFKKVLHNKK